MQAPLSTSRDAAFRSCLAGRNAFRRSASLGNRNGQIRAAVQEATQLNKLSDWLQQDRGCSVEYLEPSTSGSQQSWTVQRGTQQGQVLFSLPGDHAVTMTDVQTEPAVAGVAEGRGELTGLALWLMYERSKVLTECRGVPEMVATLACNGAEGAGIGMYALFRLQQFSQGGRSSWQPFLDSLPEQTESPMLWPRSEQEELLQGSPVLQEAQQRSKALDEEWQSLSPALPSLLQSSGAFTQQAFRAAMSVVLAHATYLQSAKCFALLPILSTLPHTSSDTGALIDFDSDSQSVQLTAQRAYRPGEPIATFDGRPAGEVLLATGTVEEKPESDFLTVRATLVASDKLYVQKREVLQAEGFSDLEDFPIFEDRMPTQLLAYLRLARLQNVAEFAKFQQPLLPAYLRQTSLQTWFSPSFKVTFEQDVVLSQANEYEVLQLLLADMRDRLTSFEGSLEDELKVLQNQQASRRQIMAARVRLAEKRILQGTLDAVRKQLAPIRGIPTKAGMQDPNSDLLDIFKQIEDLPTAPKKFFDGLKRWASGDGDPTWKK